MQLQKTEDPLCTVEKRETTEADIMYNITAQIPGHGTHFVYEDSFHYFGINNY